MSKLYLSAVGITCGLISVQASSAIVAVNEDSTSLATFDNQISSTDLVNDGQATLAGETVSPDFFGGGATNDGLNDGTANTAHTAFFDHGNNRVPATITYELNTSVNTLGYDITEIQSVAGWSGVNETHGNQTFELFVSVVGDASFSSLGSFSNEPYVLDTAGGDTSTRITLTDDSGLIASGVDEIRFVYSQNTFSGFSGVLLREIDIEGVATVPEPSSMALATLGGLAIMSRRRRK